MESDGETKEGENEESLFSIFEERLNLLLFESLTDLFFTSEENEESDGSGEEYDELNDES